jgi:hypothetical protein
VILVHTLCPVDWSSQPSCHNRLKSLNSFSVGHLAGWGIVFSKNMNAGAVACGFEQRKTKGVLPRAKDAASQPFAVFRHPISSPVLDDLEVVQRRYRCRRHLGHDSPDNSLPVGRSQSSPTNIRFRDGIEGAGVNSPYRRARKSDLVHRLRPHQPPTQASRLQPLPRRPAALIRSGSERVPRTGNVARRRRSDMAGIFLRDPVDEYAEPQAELATARIEHVNRRRRGRGVGRSLSSGRAEARTRGPGRREMRRNEFLKL